MGLAIATARTAAGALVLAALVACDDGPSGPPPDTSAPEVLIVFPSGEAYDRDGDGLVDVEIELADPAGAVDPESVVITSSRDLGPNGLSGSDLTRSFAVVERTEARIVLEETTEALLPSGSNAITVTARDTAGNEAEASVAFTLPPAAEHTLLDLPPFNGFDPVGIVVLPDGSRGFVPYSDGQVVPFDARTLEVSPAVSRGFTNNAALGTYDPATDRIYFASTAFSRLEVFDPEAGRFDGSIPVSARNVGATLGPSGLLYVALRTSPATVGIVDPVRREEVGFLETDITNTLNPHEPPLVVMPAVTPAEDRLYAPLGTPPGGVLVFDLPSGDLVTVIDIDPDPDHRGESQDVVLNVLRRRLYVTDFFGLSEVDIDTNELSRRIAAPRIVTKFLSLSPSGERLFVSTAHRFGGTPESWIVDPATFSIVQRFEVTRPPPFAGENVSAFRPDGQLIFVNRATRVAVYLNREP